jgi:hypothetical protein
MTLPLIAERKAVSSHGSCALFRGDKFSGQKLGSRQETADLGPTYSSPLRTGGRSLEPPPDGKGDEPIKLVPKIHPRKDAGFDGGKKSTKRNSGGFEHQLGDGIDAFLLAVVNRWSGFSLAAPLHRL